MAYTITMLDRDSNRNSEINIMVFQPKVHLPGGGDGCFCEAYNTAVFIVAVIEYLQRTHQTPPFDHDPAGHHGMEQARESDIRC
jgi:hypothetical protein